MTDDALLFSAWFTGRAFWAFVLAHRPAATTELFCRFWETAGCCAQRRMWETYFRPMCRTHGELDGLRLVRVISVDTPVFLCERCMAAFTEARAQCRLSGRPGRPSQT